MPDITLNDFANSRYSTGKTRIKKAATNNVVREVLELKETCPHWPSSAIVVVKELSTHTDSRAWYDKLEDYEGDFEFVEEEDEDGARDAMMTAVTHDCKARMVWTGAVVVTGYLDLETATAP
uniref:Uncharacterized protein n=1 Tax=Timema douglasi TaxID=61478 RepID=A0A7R8VST2_TIMDO|nr:unnamed protein product [Timema douglasi]